jgi:multiple sugar transport system permease protein
MNKNNKAVDAGRNRRRWTAERRRDFLQSVAYLAPSVIGVLVFFVVPFGIVVYYSLIQGPADPTFVGLTNFKNLLGNYAFQTAIKNTATFS